jgi:hypothetical protein
MNTVKVQKKAPVSNRTKKQKKAPAETSPGHLARFEQLLDDAVGACKERRK